MSNLNLPSLKRLHLFLSLHALGKKCLSNFLVSPFNVLKGHKKVSLRLLLLQAEHPQISQPVSALCWDCQGRMQYPRSDLKCSPRINIELTTKLSLCHCSQLSLCNQITPTTTFQKEKSSGMDVSNRDDICSKAASRRFRWACAPLDGRWKERSSTCKEPSCRWQEHGWPPQNPERESMRSHHPYSSCKWQ